MTLAVIVQARSGSSRLPGKTLKPLGNRSSLIRVLDRCAMIPGVDTVVCAIPDNEPDDSLEREVQAYDYPLCKGSELDVLSRYAKAAREADADIVMRVTSDCPFIDPAVSGQVIQLLKDSHADYATNSMPPLFPHGLDCGVFPAVLLHEADRVASTPYEREHVTPWMRNHVHLKKANLRGPGNGLERLRWTLDYPEDLAFFQAIYREMGEAAATASAAEIAALCLRRPDLVAINSGQIDDERLGAPARADLETSAAPFLRAA